jgi:acyl-CoA thioester hydrolase
VNGTLHSVDFRLSYGDCDPAGIVYYASYYRWMERVHTEWWFLSGIRLDELSDLCGVSIVTRAASAEFLWPLRVFDLVACRMSTARVGRSSFTMAFDFLAEEGRSACTSRMTLVCVGSGGEPAPVPGVMRKPLGEPHPSG